MNFKSFRRVAIILVTAAFAICSAKAQHPNFFHRLDVASGNTYTFVGTNLITAFTNYLTHDVLFDNSFQYSFFNGSIGNSDIKTKPENLLGLRASDLFNDMNLGVKLGYRSSSYGSFNWGVYGSAHWRLNQFQSKVGNASEYGRERFSYLRPGVGVFAMFGDIEHKLKFQIEVGARYNIPLAYTGMYGTSTDVLDSGLTTHYALKLGGAYDFTGGIYLDINHFNFFKPEYCNKFKMMTIGVTFTITPKRGEGLYGD